MNNNAITKNQGERIWTTRLLLKSRENAYEQQDYRITKNQGEHIWTRLLLKAGKTHMNNQTITKNQVERIWTTILLLKTKENAYEQQDYY